MTSSPVQSIDHLGRLLFRLSVALVAFGGLVIVVGLSLSLGFVIFFGVACFILLVGADVLFAIAALVGWWQTPARFHFLVFEVILVNSVICLAVFVPCLLGLGLAAGSGGLRDHERFFRQVITPAHFIALGLFPLSGLLLFVGGIMSGISESKKG